MYGNLLLLSSVFLHAVVVQAADTTINVGDVYVKGLEASGDIEIQRGDGVADPNKVTIKLGCVKEISDEGEVAVAGHSFTDFSDSTSSWSVALLEDEEIDHVNVARVSLTKTLTDTATVKFLVYLWRNDGAVEVSGDDVEMKRGNVKVNVAVENWVFCENTGGCAGVTGTKLDICLEVSSSADPTQQGNSAKYELGGQITLTVPAKFKKDGTVTSLETDYPSLDTKTFTVRVPKFDTSMSYAVVVGIEASPEQGVTGTGGYAQVKANSGSFRYGRSKADVDKDENTVSLELLALEEIDDTEAGAAVQDATHKITTFKNKIFEIAAPSEGNYQGVAAQRTTYETTFTNGAKLRVMVMVYKGDGKLTIGEEETPVKSGNLKFGLTLSNWDFCGASGVDCDPDVTGKYVDVSMGIKSSGTPVVLTTDAGEPMKVNLGGEDTLYLSKKLRVDRGDDRVDMATGYPKLEQQGENYVIKFRLPKFDSSVFYDPIIALPPQTPVADTTKSIVGGDVTVDVVSTSGQISMRPNGLFAETAVTINLISLQEMTAAGVGIGTNILTSQEFAFEAGVADGAMNGIDARTVSYMATLSNGAELRVTIGVFKAAGTVTQGSEKLEVLKDDMEFIFEVSKWTFCTAETCNDQVGDAMDLTIEVKGNNEGPKEETEEVEENEGRKWQLGSGSVVFSQKVTVDSGDPQALADTYPKLVADGDKKVFKIRLPKFNNNVVYDPIARLASGATGVQVSLLTLLCATLAIVLQKCM